jgi:uncharacterized membrane protein
MKLPYDSLRAKIKEKKKAFSMNVVVSAILVLYPVLIFLSLVVFKLPIRYLSIFVILFASFYIFINAKNFRGKNRALVFLCPAILFSIGIICLLVNTSLLLKIYPMLADIAYLLIFGISLFIKPPIIYQFASTLDKAIDNRLPKTVLEQWCKKMTITWCVFFIVDGLIAFLTVYWVHANIDVLGIRPDVIWGIYNGGVSYAAMGVIFIAQFIDYKIICKKEKEGSLNVG